jgi:hypothetical protein
VKTRRGRSTELAPLDDVNAFLLTELHFSSHHLLTVRLSLSLLEPREPRILSAQLTGSPGTALNGSALLMQCQTPSLGT